MRHATDTRTCVDALIVELRSGPWTGWGEVFMPHVPPLWGWARRVASLLSGKNAADLDLLLADWPVEHPGEFARVQDLLPPGRGLRRRGCVHRPV
jgi:hypothetical protein